MLSSSPPPLDDCPDNDDDEEEFGNFASANIPFDSSFDSPISGEKYKSFKTGTNGINDITLNNDLNTFCSYTDSEISSSANITLNFSPPTQNNCKKNFSPNESEDELYHDSVKKHHSSSEDIPCKKNSLTSQNCVPDSLCIVNNEIKNSYNSDEENELFKSRKQFPICSTGETLKNESDFTDSDNSNCDSDKVNKTLFVPICDDEFEDMTEDSSDIHVTHSETRNVSQSTYFAIEKCQESSSDVNSLECVVEKSNGLQIEVSKNPENSVEQRNSVPENLNDISSRDQSDEFDDFQTAISNSTFEMESSELNKKSLGENENIESFEANFSDFQSGEDYDFQNNEFDDFQSSKSIAETEYHSTNTEEFSTFQAPDVSAPSEPNELDDFQSSTKTFINKDSSNVEIKKNEDKKICEKSVLQDSECEEFDDFQACPEIVPSEPGFADFETQSFDQKEDSEFADFESASFNTAFSETFQNSLAPSSSISNQEKSVDKLSTVMNTIFPLKENDSSAADVSYVPESEVLEQCNKSRRLWEKLHEVEQAPGMRFQWGVSHSFQQLLRSVNVDYHSILRTSSVPIFASSLSLLEPVKGQTNSVSHDSEDTIQSPKDPIPPVEFDWNSSGLINPLDSGQAASILMDLSFLTSSESVTSSSLGNNSFENELLKPSPVPSCPENSNTNCILEELLSKNVCSIPNSKTAHRQSNLSEEANNVLDQLPDLSFMRAKVLMFPISSKT
ncbi:aftiphilin [Caerostris darwini]|uniref:Aftiphilin n=1 Tax=Caerostris darwini TaxID=1538125 RepID=A0AAV4ST76_9ARAC|nr:aftiphilin [Caerostris darwini]